jgi:hypothetical protein
MENEEVGDRALRRKTKNNLPNLVILFPLLCGKLFSNNLLFFKKFILIKENIITNLGRLFFVLRLTKYIVYSKIKKATHKLYPLSIFTICKSRNLVNLVILRALKKQPFYQ